MSQGYLSWTTREHRVVVLNGVQVSDETSHPPHSWQRSVGSVVVDLLNRGSIVQGFARGGSEPLNMNPITDTLDIFVSDRDLLVELESAAAQSDAGFASLLYLDVPIVDVWRVGMNPGATTWKTSRRTPWGLPGITRATRPPAAQLVTGATAVDLTVIDEGTPEAGEILIPATTGTDYATVTTLPLEGDFLRLVYAPEIRVIIDELEHQLTQPNDWRVKLSFREILGGNR